MAQHATSMLVVPLHEIISCSIQDFPDIHKFLDQNKTSMPVHEQIKSTASACLHLHCLAELVELVEAVLQQLRAPYRGEAVRPEPVRRVRLLPILLAVG